MSTAITYAVTRCNSLIPVKWHIWFPFTACRQWLSHPLSSPQQTIAIAAERPLSHTWRTRWSWPPCPRWAARNSSAAPRRRGAPPGVARCPRSDAAGWWWRRWPQWQQPQWHGGFVVFQTYTYIILYYMILYYIILYYIILYYIVLLNIIVCLCYFLMNQRIVDMMLLKCLNGTPSLWCVLFVFPQRRRAQALVISDTNSLRRNIVCPT